ETADGVGGHRLVDGAPGGGKLGSRIAGQVEARVDGNAVTADGYSGAVDVAEGLAVCRVDHALDVDPRSVGEARQLVREGDVEVAVGRLGELRELRCLGAPHRAYLGVDERGGELPLGLKAARRLERRCDAPPRRAYGERRLDAHGRSRPEARADVGDDRV